MSLSKPTIPGADPMPRAPREPLPAGACDSHAHLFGPQEHYPYQHNRSYTPPEASEAAYRRLLHALGFQRAVLVQPSVYGTDNRLMLETLAHQKPDDAIEWRGVAVVNSAITNAELQHMDRLGVRGVRVNLVFPGGVNFSDIETLSRRIAELGWHVQFLLDVSRFEDLAGKLGRLPTPVVIDHMGHLPAHKGTTEPGFAALLKMLDNGKAWVKLTGPNRISAHQRAPYQDVDPLFLALVEANSEHCIFGTDWPHVQLPTPIPNDGELVDELLRLLPSAALRQRILVDNPARLYGFAPS